MLSEETKDIKRLMSTSGATHS